MTTQTTDTAAPPPPDEALARVSVRVTGRVQGVYYRASAATEARNLGVTGWVRNLPDGTVEAMAEGPRGALTRFVLWCHHGPPSARVERVEVLWSTAEGLFAGFEVRH